MQFIKREIETAFGLTRLALAERAIGHVDLAEEAGARARRTYEDFRMYLPMVASELTAAEKHECEENLESLEEALKYLE